MASDCRLIATYLVPQLEKMEADQQALNSAPGIELALVASLLDGNEDEMGNTARAKWQEEQEAAECSSPTGAIIPKIGEPT